MAKHTLMDERLSQGFNFINPPFSRLLAQNCQLKRLLSLSQSNLEEGSNGNAALSSVASTAAVTANIISSPLAKRKKKGTASGAPSTATTASANLASASSSSSTEEPTAAAAEIVTEKSTNPASEVPASLASILEPLPPQAKTSTSTTATKEKASSSKEAAVKVESKVPQVIVTTDAATLLQSSSSSLQAEGKGTQACRIIFAGNSEPVPKESLFLDNKTGKGHPGCWICLYVL